MDSIIKVIGIIVFAVVMYSVPILFTCSVLLHWHPFIKFVGLICVAFQFMILCIAIQKIAEDEGGK